MKIRKKGAMAQAMCRHNFQEGELSLAGGPRFQNLSGTALTTVCVKCGKIKGRRFIPNADGS